MNTVYQLQQIKISYNNYFQELKPDFMFVYESLTKDEFLECQIVSYAFSHILECMDQFELDDMAKINALIKLPNYMLMRALNIVKMNNFMWTQSRQINQFSNSFHLAFKIYTRFLEVTQFSNQLYINGQNYMMIHGNFLDKIIHEKGYLTSEFSKDYISYCLQAIRLLNLNCIDWFLNYLINIDQLDTLSFMNCIQLFLRMPDCDFQKHALQLCKFIEKNFGAFLENYDNTQYAKINAMKQLIRSIIACTKEPSSKFVEQVILKLLNRNSFWESVVKIIKRCGCFCFFKDWVSMIISNGNLVCACLMVQYVTFNFSYQAPEFKVHDLMSENFQWADYWAKQIIKKNTQMLQNFLESHDFYLFILANRILMHVEFESEQSFFLTLNCINYHQALEKLIDNDDARNSAVELFSVFLNDGQEYMNQICMNLKAK